MTALGLSVDNLLGLIYFPFISWMGDRFVMTQKKEGYVDGGDGVIGTAAVHDHDDDSAGTDPSSMLQNAVTTVALSLTIAATAECLSTSIPILASTPLGAPVPVSTALTVLIATVFDRPLRPLISVADLLGKTLLLLFFGAAGNAPSP